MLHLSLIVLVMWCGVLKEPFKVAEADSAHNQIMVRAAMASDGRFAVAWVDSVCYRDPFIPNEHELYVRFFDNNGNPMTQAQQIAKLADTNWIYWPCLAMDSAGGAVLLWEEGPDKGYDSNYVRFQLFDKDGNTRGSAQTVEQGKFAARCPIGLECNNQGEFAVAWGQRLWTSVGARIWVKRYDADGIPEGEPFLVHEDFAEDYDTRFKYPQVALSDAGDLVVTWRSGVGTTQRYPRFQVFDANDESILPWEPEGHRVDDGDERYGVGLSEVHYLDNDRFVIFWVDLLGSWLDGRGFSDRGLTRHSIQNLVHDKSDSVGSVHHADGYYGTAVSFDDRFALTYIRSHSEGMGSYDHHAGVLGRIEGIDPIVTGDIFEYSAPWEDTVWRTLENFLSVPTQPPAVGACDDQLVWVYSRINTDTTCEAFAVLTDWDMTSISEPVTPPATHLNWEIGSAVGSEVVLKYSDCPEGFHARVFDATGRRIDELHSSQTQGTISWGEGQNPGVYFIKSLTGNAPATKVILAR